MKCEYLMDRAENELEEENERIVIDWFAETLKDIQAHQQRIDELENLIIEKEKLSVDKFAAEIRCGGRFR